MPQIHCGMTIQLDSVLCNDLARKDVFFGFSTDSNDIVCMSNSIESLADGYNYFCKSRVGANLKLRLPNDVLVFLNLNIGGNILVYKMPDSDCIFMRAFRTG